MGVPVVTVASGGMPVTDVTATTGRGTPVTEATNGFGRAVSKVASGGMAVAYETLVVWPPVVTVPATTWSPTDKHATYIALSNGNLTATFNNFVGAARSTTKQTSGKSYMEFTYTTSGTANYAGIATSAASLSAGLSGSVEAVALGLAGGGQVTVFGTAVGPASLTVVQGDKVCLAVDMTNSRIWFRVNAGQWNGSGTADPATNVGGHDISAKFPATAAYFAGSGTLTNGSAITVNGGATAFAQTAPSGFVSWNTSGQ